MNSRRLTFLEQSKIKPCGFTISWPFQRQQICTFPTSKANKIDDGLLNSNMTLCR